MKIAVLSDIHDNVQTLQKALQLIKQEKCEAIIFCGDYYSDLLEIELDGKKIAVCHKPEFAEGLAATGKYDVVFHGHTHKMRNEKIDDTLLVNPEEVYGGGGKSTFAIYNTPNSSVDFKEV